MQRLLSVVFILVLSGCTTIHFDNGDVQSTKAPSVQWYHNTIYDLVEVSEPVDLKQACGQSEWASVTRQLTVQNVLLSVPVNLFGPFWYPKTVTVACQ